MKTRTRTRKILALLLSFAMVFSALPVSAFGTVTKEAEKTELPEYIFSNAWNKEYDVLYHESGKAYTYKGQDVTFNGSNLTAGGTTYDVKNAETTVAVKTEKEVTTVTLSGINTPVGGISGEWNSYFDGEQMIQYDFNGEVVKGNDLSTITFKNLEPGTHVITGGKIYEAANEYSDGHDFGDGKGTVTARAFGYLPDLTIEIEGTKVKADGVYEGTGQGRNGNVTVGVHIKDNKIVKVEEVAQHESAGYWAMAVEIFSRIVKEQSADIDATSGATLSSNGIKAAVKDALTKDVPARPLPVEPENPGTPVDPSQLPEEYLGVSVGSEVPSSFENDLWTQYDHKELNIGETASVCPRRVHEAVVNTTQNDLEMPHFNYEVILGKDVISLEGGDNTHKGVKALKNGNAVVKITYDRHVHSNGDRVFEATDPINTQYVTFSVGNDKSISITDSVKETKYDTIYYTTGTTVNYPVTVNAEGADVTVKCNGLSVKNENGTFNVPLENRYNIVEITAKKGDKTRTVYHVISARKIKINIENITRPGKFVAANDKVRVSFNGIKMPLYKLATIYNPQWGDGATRVYYEMDGKVYEGRCGQWDIATKNSFEVSFDKAGEAEFKNGEIRASWWGSELGYDQTHADKGEANLNAGTEHGNFCTMPDFSITVAEAVPATEVVLNKTNMVLNLKESEKLTTTLNPSNTTYENLVFESADDKIARVEKDGTVTAVATGETEITVSVKDLPEVKAVCRVTVNKGPYEELIKTIDALPAVDEVTPDKAWEIKGGFADIEKAYNDLAEDKKLVTNYDKFITLKEHVEAMLKAEPYRFTDKDGHVMHVGKKAGSFGGFWDNFDVYEVEIPMDVTELDFEAFVPVRTRIYGYIKSEVSASYGEENVKLGDDVGKIHMDLKNGIVKSVRSDWYNNGKFDGPWSGEWVDVAIPFDRMDLNMGANIFLDITPAIKTGEGWNQFDPLPEYGGNYKLTFKHVDFTEKDKEAAAEVDKLISDLGKITDLKQEAAVKAARDAYKALATPAKEYVKNLKTLEKAEAEIAELKKIEADKEAAAEADKKIASIGKVTLAKEKLIADAETAYNNLTKEQKAYVKNLNKLEEAKAALKELKAEAAKPVAKPEKDKAGNTVIKAEDKVVVVDPSSIKDAVKNVIVEFEDKSSVEYSKDALKEILKQISADAINVKIELKETSKADKSMTGAQKKAVKASKGVKVFEITLKVTEADGSVTTIHNFNGGKATITVPFVKKAGINLEVYRVEENGKLVLMNSSYADGKLSWITDGHSHYMVKEVATADKAETPKTGDDANFLGWIILMIMASGCAVAVRRKENN